MKKISLKKHDQFIITLWILLTLVLIIKLLRNSPLLETTIIAICYSSPLLFSNLYLCKHLLPKCIKKKNMSLFVLHFILLSFLAAILMTLVLLAVEYLEQDGTIFHSAIFPPGETFPTYFLDQLFGTIMINLAFCGPLFYYEHNKIENRLLELQLHTLKAQINPHFTANIMNYISDCVGKRNDIAKLLLSKYSELMNYEILNSEKENVTIAEEVVFLKNVIDIQKIRWEDILEIHCNWEIENEEQKIPTLLLLPLIEIAFKHVLEDSTKKGKIEFHFIQKGNSLSFNVKKEKQNYSIIKSYCLELEDLKQRLTILYNGKYKLFTEDTYSFCSLILEVAV